MRKMLLKNQLTGIAKSWLITGGINLLRVPSLPLPTLARLIWMIILWHKKTWKVCKLLLHLVDWNLKCEASITKIYLPGGVCEGFEFFGKLFLGCQKLFSLHLEMETIITNENSQKEIWRIYLKLDSSGDVRDEDDDEANKEEDQVFKNHNEHKLWNRNVKLKGKISNCLEITLSPKMT